MLPMDRTIFVKRDIPWIIRFMPIMCAAYSPIPFRLCGFASVLFESSTISKGFFPAYFRASFLRKGEKPIRYRLDVRVFYLGHLCEYRLLHFVTGKLENTHVLHGNMIFCQFMAQKNRSNTFIRMFRE